MPGPTRQTIAQWAATALLITMDDCVLAETKSVKAVLPIHKAQLLSDMKLLDIPLGLLVNFNELKLTDGVSRLILPGASLSD